MEEEAHKRLFSLLIHLLHHQNHFPFPSFPYKQRVGLRPPADTLNRPNAKLLPLHACLYGRGIALGEQVHSWEHVKRPLPLSNMPFEDDLLIYAYIANLNIEINSCIGISPS